MKQYFGEVISLEDPDKVGKIKVRVFGVYDSLPDDVIPFAMPRYITHNYHNLPPIGSEVMITFMNDDIHFPIWQSIGGYTLPLELSSDDYESAAILLHKDLAQYGSDGLVTLHFTDSEGLILKLEKSGTEAKIELLPDNTIKLNSGSRLIHISNDFISLGQESKSSEPAVLGDKNADMLNSLNEQDKVLFDELLKYLQQLVQVAGANPYTMPLVAPITTFIATLTAKFTPGYGQNKTDIPLTKSKKTSLD